MAKRTKKTAKKAAKKTAKKSAKKVAAKSAKKAAKKVKKAAKKVTAKKAAKSAARKPAKTLDIFCRTLLGESEPHLRGFLNAASQDRAGVGNSLEIMERASGQLLSLCQAGEVRELLR